jgi:hypothetical protein
MNSFGHSDSAIPVLLGAHDLQEGTGAEGIFVTLSPVALTGESTLLVEFSVQDQVLDRYCRFARPRQRGLPRTFSTCAFASAPPGLRVGPWPGWRGIPDLPPFELSHGRTVSPIQIMFWGDEIVCGRMRGIARFTGESDGHIAVRSPDPGVRGERVLVYRTRAVHAVPRAMALRSELSGVHPRLLVTPAELRRLRAFRSGAGAGRWHKITDLLNAWDRAFEITPEAKLMGAEEALSPEDRLLVSAFLAMVDGAPEHVARGRGSLASYIALTRQPDFEPLRIDTQSGEVLFLLCCAYDWLHEHLTEREHTEASGRIRQVAEVCGGFLGESRRDYGQAHYLGCGLGLLAYAILFDDDPRAREWGPRLRGALERALELLPPDGSFAHGANLWIYEFGFLLRWVELIRAATGEDLWLGAPALRRASEFRFWTLSHDGLLGLAFGDPQFRVGGDSWCHWLIASRTGSASAQWLAGRLCDLPRQGVDFRNIPARRRVYEFLYHTPDLPERGPALGTAHFTDAGQVTVRSERTVFTFRSGPPLGMHRYRSGEYGGYGHADPASGSFMIFRDGRFVASGPGPLYRRETALHNVMTVNGQGQIGDSAVWLPDFIPPDMLAPLPEVRQGERGVAVTVELSPAYAPHLGVTGYRRSILVSVDAFIAGVDILSCAGESRLEWNAHAWEKFEPIPMGSSPAYSIGGAARLVLLHPEHLECTTGMSEFVPAYPNDGRRDFFLKGSLRGSGARIVWCYLFGDLRAPQWIGGEGESFRLVFDHGSVVAFDGRWLSLEGPA